MPSPSDLARIDQRLQKFWREYGAIVDFTIGAFVLAAVAWCIGYAMGVGAR